MARLVRATLFLVSIFLGTGYAAQDLEVYRAKHRLAQELVPIAESALGNEGQVTLDSRTATLVLSGTPEAVRRALAMLEKIDRPLHQLVLTHEIRDFRDLERLGARIGWKVSVGSARIGTLPFGSDGHRVALDAGRETTQSTSRGVLKLLEGSSGLIVTGKALPFVYEPFWGSTTFIPIETGFEATATILADGLVQLELTPFSGRVDDGGELRYTSAATSITLRPGETVIYAETSRETERSNLNLGGGGRDKLREQQVLLITVELDRP
jgi:hypothetical protein